MNSRDFKVLFLYECKSKHNSVSTDRNINGVFRNGSVNERTIRCWYAKFETGDENLTNNNRGRPEIVVDNEVLRTVAENQAILLEIMRRTRCIFCNHFTPSKTDWQS